jgi:hypothetical protein
MKLEGISSNGKFKVQVRWTPSVKYTESKF